MKTKIIIISVLLIGATFIISGCTKTDTTATNNSTTPTSNSNEGINNSSATSDASERDVQRRKDIENVYQAIRDWSSDNNNAKYLNVNYEALATTLDPKYIDVFPYDPSRPGNYYYVVSEDGRSFGLGTWFETSDTPWTQTLNNTGDPDAMDLLLEDEMGGYPTW